MPRKRTYHGRRMLDGRVYSPDSPDDGEYDGASPDELTAPPRRDPRSECTMIYDVFDPESGVMRHTADGPVLSGELVSTECHRLLYKQPCLRRRTAGDVGGGESESAAAGGDSDLVQDYIRHPYCQRHVLWAEVARRCEELDDASSGELTSPSSDEAMPTGAAAAAIPRGYTQCDTILPDGRPCEFASALAPLFTLAPQPSGKLRLACRWCQLDAARDARIINPGNYGGVAPASRRLYNRSEGELWLAYPITTFLNLMEELREFGLAVTFRDEHILRGALEYLTPSVHRRVRTSQHDSIAISAADVRSKKIKRILNRGLVIDYWHNWTCPVCGDDIPDTSKWTIDWWRDTATCRSCYRAGFREPFLSDLLPCGVASDDVWRRRPEPAAWLDAECG